MKLISPPTDSVRLSRSAAYRRKAGAATPRPKWGSVDGAGGVGELPCFMNPNVTEVSVAKASDAREETATAAARGGGRKTAASSYSAMELGSDGGVAAPAPLVTPP